MINHTWILNFLVQRYKLQSYLEIGVHTKAINFDKIKCSDTIGVDPAVSAQADCQMTSDEYFEKHCERRFDLIFIDGLHHAEQVQKDFENSLQCLNEGGFIMLHDTNPTLEKYTEIPRKTKIWNGDVYKFIWRLKTYRGIKFITADIDHGCTIVWKDKRMMNAYVPSYVQISWDLFNANKYELINIISIQDLTKYLPDARSHSQEYREI